MRINAENRTDWMIAFHEGLLSPSEREAMRAFLVLHPEFNEEFETLGATVLSLDDEPKTDWSALLKPEIPADLDQRAIVLGRYAEDELSPDEKKSLELDAKENASLREELDLLQHVRLKNGGEEMDGSPTLISDADGWPAFLEPKLAELNSKFRLEPNEAVVFAGKEALIRKQGTVIEFRPILRWAVAACAVLTLWLSIPDNGFDTARMAQFGAWDAELTKTGSAAKETLTTPTEIPLVSTSPAHSTGRSDKGSLAQSTGTQVEKRIPRLQPRPAITLVALQKRESLQTSPIDRRSVTEESPAMAMATPQSKPQYISVQQWIMNKASEKVGQDKEAGESFGLALLETAVEKMDQKTALPVQLELDTQKEKKPCRRFSFRIGSVEFARSGCQPRP